MLMCRVPAIHSGGSQCIAVRCSMLQCVIVCRSVVQGVPSGRAMLICRGPAIYSGERGKERARAVCCVVLRCVALCCVMLQCVAVCCSVLQCVAVCRSVLQCVPRSRAMLICRGLAICSGARGKQKVRAVCCSVLRCVAVCCSVLQCVGL